MQIVYAFNKRGFERDYWTREISAASDDRYTFIPFIQEGYIDFAKVTRAQLLDNYYYAKDPGLMRLYADLSQFLREKGADALIADNAFPYHPEFLRDLSVFKVLRTSDGPLTAYDRDFALAHAYDMVLHHSPAYSEQIDMNEKLRYVGARDPRLWTHGLFDGVCDLSKNETNILDHPRDIDVIFIGSLFVNKMPLLARVKKAFGRRFRIHGLTTWKRNLYFNTRFGFPGWVRPIAFEDYVGLYQRSKIGINVHNRGDYTIGSYRLFELPANGVMQISDGGKYLETYYRVGEEVIGYRHADDLIDKIAHYLKNDGERREIALAGYRRVMRDHRIAHKLREAGDMIEHGMRHRPIV